MADSSSESSIASTSSLSDASSLSSSQFQNETYQKIENLYLQLKHSFKVAEVKDTKEEAVSRGESVEPIEEALKSKYDREYEILDGMMTSVQLNNQMINQEIIDNAKNMPIHGLKKMMWMEIVSGHIKFACVEFEGSIHDYKIHEFSDFYFNSVDYKNSDEIKRYIGDKVKEYHEKEFVHHFFEDQQVVQVALTNGSPKRTLSFRNVLMHIRTRSSTFLEDKVGSNLFDEFIDLFDNLDFAKKFKISTVLSVSISNIVGMKILKADDDKKNRYDFNVNINGGPNLMIPQDVDEGKRYGISYFAIFGKFLDEWEALEYFITDHEARIFQKYRDDIPDIFEHVSTADYLPHLLRMTIETSPLYVNSTKKNPNLEIGLKEFIGYTEGNDVSNLLFDHVFVRMRDEIQRYAVFLQNRAATLVSLAILATLEDHYFKKIAPNYKKDDQCGMPIVKMTGRHTNYNLVKNMHKTVERRCTKLATFLWRRREDNGDILTPKFEFDTHPDSEIYGTCVLSHFLSRR